MIGLFSILAICITFVTITVFFFHRLRGNIEFLVKGQTPVLIELQLWSGDANQAGSALLQLLMQGYDSELERLFNVSSETAEDSMSKLQKNINKNFEKKTAQVILGRITPGEESMNDLFQKGRELFMKKVKALEITDATLTAEIHRWLESINNTSKSVGKYFQETESKRIELDVKRFFDLLDKAKLIFPALLIILGIIFTFLISTGISGPLNKLMHTMGEAEKGNLETRLDLFSKDEFQNLADSFNRMLSGICQMIAKVISTSNDLATSSQELSSASVESAATLLEISKNVNEINTSTKDIAGNIEKASKTVDNFSESSQQVAQLAQTAVEAVNTTTQAAAGGGMTVKKSVDMVGKIKESVDIATQVILDLDAASKQISEIVNTITGIASQTNLLALNAAIEAARAGDQGKGFTVVAEEVRKLAEAAAEAAEAIGMKIEDILTKTQNAVDSMTMGRGRVDDGIHIIREVNSKLDNIIANVNDVNKKITEISRISVEQSQNALMMSRTIEDISKLTKETSARTGVVATSVEQQTTTVSQISSSTEDLASLADELNALVSRFTIEKNRN